MFHKHTAPCKGCDKRAVDPAAGYTCHSDCAAYLAYRADKVSSYDDKLKYQGLGEYRMATKQRMIKRLHKR